MIRIFPDYETLCLEAADLILKKSGDAIERNGRFSLVLSGGSTPRRLYEILADRTLRKKTPWEKIDIFWGDERCVPENDPRSNQLMARETLLDHIPIPEENIHPIRFDGSPKASADKYEAQIKSYFKDRETSFNMILLGLGEDGHTASLFPRLAVSRRS